MKIIFLLTTLFLVSCASLNSRVPNNVPIKGALEKIEDSDVESFPKINGTIYLKFIVHPDSSGKWNQINIIDPRVFAFHFQYLASLPEFKDYTFKQVEAISLDKNSRKVLLGTIYDQMDFSEGHQDPKTLFTLTTSELLSPIEMNQVQNALRTWMKKNNPDSYDLQMSGPYFYAPQAKQVTEALARTAEFAKAKIQFRMPDAPKGTSTYTSGWGIGKVSILKTPFEVEQGIANGSINQNTILIIGNDLPELPPVAGIITEQPLTEASHLVLLAQMYSIPLVYEKNAIQKYLQDKDKNVFLQSNVEAKSFEWFKDLTEAEFFEIKKLKTKPKLQVTVNWDEISIKVVDEVKVNELASYGGKAMQFGIIRRTISQNTQPTVVAVPVHYYQKFIQSAKLPSGVPLKDGILQVLSSIPANAQYSEIDHKMTSIRSLFKSAVIDQQFFNSIRTQILEKFPENEPDLRIKVRSSSNVEDGAEFNGAGLYDSEGVCLANCSKKDDFAKGLIKVWSSLYSTRGFWARMQFQVDESKVGMGLVVHRPYKGELANGVIRFKRTKNYNGELENQSEVLAVPGEELSVTNAAQGGLNERLKISNGNLLEHRPFKDFPKGRTLMEKKHYLTLEQLMGKLFDQRPNPAVEEIESEWKLINTADEERVHIKQVRAIPKTTVGKFAGGIKYKVYTGGEIHYVGGWPNNSREMARRIEKFVVHLESFTSHDFEMGKLKLSAAKVQIQGLEYSFTIKNLGFKAEKNYYDKNVFELTNKMLGQFVFEVNISKDIQAPIQTNKTISTSLLNSDTQLYLDLVHVEKETPPLVYSDVVQEVKPTTFSYKAKGCSIKVSGQFSKRWLETDNEFRSFDSVEVKGLIPNKTIKITSGYPYANYYYQQHESFTDVWIDLLADQTLNEKERDLLKNKFGRFIELSGRSGSLKLWDDSGKSNRIIKGCTQEATPEDGSGE